MALLNQKTVALSLALSVVLNGYAGAEVFGVFEGRVSLARGYAASPLPSGIGAGSRIIGCFRYWPEDALPPVPTDIGIWRYEYRGASPRNVFALAIGPHLWRSAGRFEIHVGNDRPATSNASGPLKDDFGFNYGIIHSREPTTQQHTGMPPGDSGWANLGFGSQSPPIEFLSSSELPDSADDFDLPAHLFIAGSVGARTGQKSWSVHYDVDVEDMVIRSDGKPFDRLHDAARLCADPNVASQREAQGRSAS